MEPDWKRLGHAFAEARKRVGLTQAAAAEALGISRFPILTIERGGPFTRITSTMRTYARLVGWADGSVEAVLDGGDPTLEEVSDDSSGDGRGEADRGPAPTLPPRISAELGDDKEILDHGVFDLTPDGEGGQLLVLVTGPKGASRSEVLSYFKAWKQTDRELRRLASEAADEPPEDAGN